MTGAVVGVNFAAHVGGEVVLGAGADGDVVGGLEGAVGVVAEGVGVATAEWGGCVPVTAPEGGAGEGGGGTPAGVVFEAGEGGQGEFFFVAWEGGVGEGGFGLAEGHHSLAAAVVAELGGLPGGGVDYADEPVFYVPVLGVAAAVVGAAGHVAVGIVAEVLATKLHQWDTGKSGLVKRPATAHGPGAPCHSGGEVVSFCAIILPK